MKILASMIFLIMSYTLQEQDLTGQWNGTLNVQGTQFRIVFHVNKTDDQYTATMDSPDQNATNIPVTTVNFSNHDVKFKISNIGMTYEGTLVGNSITGKWLQSGQSFPLALFKAEDPSTETKK